MRRERSPSSWWQGVPKGPSFPSRHATWAALALGTVAARCHGRVAGGLVRVVGGAVVTGVGASRVRLGIHWPSDVVAGVLLARVWAGWVGRLPRRAPCTSRWLGNRADTHHREPATERGRAATSGKMRRVHELA
ncbi:phosphatase PAP2 family protein [Georgenia muralis]|uniref:phosphatase PAP2 family protein n=1 Tax=Georgenia muralis TaxID=154117 RepID=UPI003CCC4893